MTICDYYEQFSSFTDLTIINLKITIVNLTILELRCRFCENHRILKKKRELRLSAKEKINEIKRLKEEVKIKEDKLLNNDSEYKNFKLLTDLEYKKEETLHNIAVLESKLIKLGITLIQIVEIKESVLSS